MDIRETGASLFRDHDFRLMFAADVASKLGTQVTLLAMPFIAIQLLQAPPAQVGLLAACETAAFLLIGLPAGAWVDRMRRRRVLVLADAGRFLLLASVPAAWWAGHLTMYQLYAVALLTGVLTVFFDVAYQSYVPSLVGRDRLVEGNTRLAAVESVAQVTGPSVAGFLIQLITAPVAVAVDATSYLVSAVCLLAQRRAEPALGAAAARRHLLHEVAEGVRHVMRDARLRAVALSSGMYNLFGNVAFPMLLVMFARELGLPAGTIGLVMTCIGVGGLLGAFTAGRIARLVGAGRAILLAQVLPAPAMFALPLVDRGWRLGLLAGALFVIGFFGSVYNINQVSLRQRVTPDRLLGRMNATMRFVVWGTIPVGAGLGGLIGQYVDVRTALWVGAVGMAACWLPLFFSPLRSMRELPPQVDPAA